MLYIFFIFHAPKRYTFFNIFSINFKFDIIKRRLSHISAQQKSIFAKRLFKRLEK